VSVVVPPNNTDQKVVDGPFFVTDFYGYVVLDTVMGGDCSVPQSQHTPIASSAGQMAANCGAQLHGMRMPILAGQTLCANTNSGCTVTVMGFRPY
jgi:hypothetical protein